MFHVCGLLVGIQLSVTDHERCCVGACVLAPSHFYYYGMYTVCIFRTSANTCVANNAFLAPLTVSS